MKALARIYVWWFRMDKDLECAVQQCAEYQQVRPRPPPAPLQPWQWPTRPWACAHVDFTGPIQGKVF